MITERLGSLRKGQTGRVVQVCGPLTRRFLDMGMIEGSVVEIVHEAPFGKDPITVCVRGALIAMRRNEAENIEVEIRERELNP